MANLPCRTGRRKAPAQQPRRFDFLQLDPVATRTIHGLTNRVGPLGPDEVFRRLHIREFAQQRPVVITLVLSPDEEAMRHSMILDRGRINAESEYFIIASLSVGRGQHPGGSVQSSRFSMAMGYWALSFSKALRVTR